MKVMFDLNIVLDVVQRREPHYRLSATALSTVVQGDAQGVFPCHGVTTVHYLVSRYGNKRRADELVDWLSRRFEIGTAGRDEFVRASGLALADFEDAVVCAVAEACGCDGIVTRNLRDFSRSPVRPLSPEEFLMQLKGIGQDD
jgi:predicted nucleic acid-binding protein